MTATAGRVARAACGPGLAHGRRHMARANPRRRARELVLQGLYQRQLSGNEPDAIRLQLVESHGFEHADHAYFGELWDGVGREYDALLEGFAPLLDRAPAELS